MLTEPGDVGVELRGGPVQHAHVPGADTAGQAERRAVRHTLVAECARVGPGDVLVVTVGVDWDDDHVDAVTHALVEVGLEQRAVVVRGAASVTVVPRWQLHH